MGGVGKDGVISVRELGEGALPGDEDQPALGDGMCTERRAGREGPVSYRSGTLRCNLGAARGASNSWLMFAYVFR